MNHRQIEMVLQMNGFVRKGCTTLSTARPQGHSPAYCESIHWVRQHPKKNRLQQIYIFAIRSPLRMDKARRKACIEWVNQRNQKEIAKRNLQVPPMGFLDAMDLCP